jgi:hypothetical protein
VLSGWQAIVASGDNGSFQIVVPPGKGYLLVFGPTGDYVLGEIGFNFELHGLAPDARTRISVLDPEHEWGATVDVSAEQAGAELTIRLQACGQATARFVGPDGQPIAKLQPHLFSTINDQDKGPQLRREFTVTPGAKLDLGDITISKPDAR